MVRLRLGSAESPHRHFDFIVRSIVGGEFEEPRKHLRRPVGQQRSFAKLGPRSAAARSPPRLRKGKVFGFSLRSCRCSLLASWIGHVSASPFVDREGAGRGKGRLDARPSARRMWGLTEWDVHVDSRGRRGGGAPPSPFGRGARMSEPFRNNHRLSGPRRASVRKVCLRWVDPR